MSHKIKGNTVLKVRLQCYRVQASFVSCLAGIFLIITLQVLLQTFPVLASMPVAGWVYCLLLVRFIRQCTQRLPT